MILLHNVRVGKAFLTTTQNLFLEEKIDVPDNINTNNSSAVRNNPARAIWQMTNWDKIISAH